MTMAVGSFHCNRCELTFKGEYKPQQRPRKSCPKCHKMCDLTKNNERLKEPSHDSSTNDESSFTLDPNQLLMNTAVRELNKPDPDPRWATILLNVLDKSKNLEIKTKEDVMEKYKRMDIATRLELLKSLEGR